MHRDLWDAQRKKIASRPVRRGLDTAPACGLRLQRRLKSHQESIADQWEMTLYMQPVPRHCLRYHCSSVSHLNGTFFPTLLGH